MHRAAQNGRRWGQVALTLGFQLGLSSFLWLFMLLAFWLALRLAIGLTLALDRPFVDRPPWTGTRGEVPPGGPPDASAVAGE